MDRYTHLISRVNIGPNRTDGDFLVEYRVELTERAYNVDPNLPGPLSRGEACEIYLSPLRLGTGLRDRCRGHVRRL